MIKFENENEEKTILKEDDIMKIAISTDSGYVSEHFGRCPSFTIIEIENNKVVKKDIIDNPGHSPGLIPQFLNDNSVNLIVCGGMGARAKGFFDQFGISIIAGVSGKIDETIGKLEKGNLVGGESFCKPGAGRGYGLSKDECDHPHDE
jgi:predicted Fe-Mo cluster-binding NifX family protein